MGDSCFNNFKAVPALLAVEADVNFILLFFIGREKPSICLSLRVRI